MVGGVRIHAVDAKHAVLARLHRNLRPYRIDHRNGFDRFKIPRPSTESKRLGGQSADRTDLHGVAGEVRRKRFVGKREYLGSVASIDEFDQRVTGYLIAKTRAAGTQDAALAVKQDEFRNLDGFLIVALLLDKPRLPRAVRNGVVLERTFATLVAHRTVERMVEQQELKYALLYLLDNSTRGLNNHAFVTRLRAGGNQRLSTRPFDLDETHPANGDRLEPSLVTEPRYVGPDRFSSVDQQFPFGNWRVDAVECDRHHLLCFVISQRTSPPPPVRPGRSSPQPLHGNVS